MVGYISQNKKGLLAMLLVFASILPVRSAEAPVANSAPNIISWSGVRLITLGTRYMTEMPEIASGWVTKNKEGLIKGEGNAAQAEQIKKIATSISDGMRNVGKMLVLIGVAKEYKDYFDYASNPKNPFNNKEKYTADIIKAKQDARLKYLHVILSILRDKLAKQKIDAEWLVKLFDQKVDGGISEQSLKFGIGKVGEVFEMLNIYGVGIQISSNLPVGSLVSLMLSRWPGLEKTASRFSYEDSVGVLFYMNKKEKQDDPSKDPLYSGLPSNHPLFDLLKRENYGFAAKTFEQSGAGVEGVSYAHKGAVKTAIEMNMNVRLTFLASTEVLKNFDVMNMNHTSYFEIATRNNLANAIPDNARKVVMKAQEKIQSAYDQSKHFEFLSQDVQISAAYIYGSVNEDTGEAIEVPNMMLRLSMGDYGLAAAKDRAGANDLVNVKLTPLGFMTIDAN